MRRKDNLGGSMRGKISIIVPVYNVEKYLSQCIESIINQNHKNIEKIGRAHV